MPKLLWFDGEPPREQFYRPPPRKRYGFFHFLFDCTMVVLTGGFWFLWIFVREMRK